MGVHVFSTSVRRIADALNLQNLLSLYFKMVNVNFDISDFDGSREMILRVEANNLEPVKVVRAMNDLGYDCREL